MSLPLGLGGTSRLPSPNLPRMPTLPRRSAPESHARIPVLGAAFPLQTKGRRAHSPHYCGCISRRCCGFRRLGSLAIGPVGSHRGGLARLPWSAFPLCRPAPDRVLPPRPWLLLRVFRFFSRLVFHLLVWRHWRRTLEDAGVRESSQKVIHDFDITYVGRKRATSAKLVLNWPVPFPILRRQIGRAAIGRVSLPAERNSLGDPIGTAGSGVPVPVCSAGACEEGYACCSTMRKRTKAFALRGFQRSPGYRPS